MSMNFDGRESDKPITDQEGVMFAAQPVWERNRKKKGFGRGRPASAATPTTVAPEARSFAAERDEEPMVLDTPVERPIERPIASTPVRDYPRTEYAGMNPTASRSTVTNSTLAAETETDAGLVAPIGMSRSTRTTRSAKSNSVAPAAIAAGVVALGALGAAGWYMSRDDGGVPELTPGSTTSEVASAPLANPPMATTETPGQMAANAAVPPPATPAAAEPPRAAAPAPTRTARNTARARPAESAPSAAQAGANASTTATLPDGPQPYSADTTTAPTQANPPLVTLPPAPTTEAPAAVPQTPPTATTEPTPPTEAPTNTTPPNS